MNTKIIYQISSALCSQHHIVSDTAQKHAEPPGVLYASLWRWLSQYAQEQHGTAGQHLQYVSVVVWPALGLLRAGQAALHARWHHVAVVWMAAAAGLHSAARAVQQYEQPQNNDQPIRTCGPESLHPPVTLPWFPVHVQHILSNEVLQHERRFLSKLQKRPEPRQTAASYEQGQLKLMWTITLIFINVYLIT